MRDQAKRLKSIIKEKEPPKVENPKTKIVAITSGKGGVGKSVISANIGSILAERGYRVCLFDADFSLANLDILFNIKVKKNLLNFLKGEVTLDEIIVKIDENLSLIPGDSGDEILDFNLTTIREKSVLNEDLLDRFDYLIIDTPTGVDSRVKTFLKDADEIVVVTVPNPLAITDSYALIKSISHINENLNLIVNMSRGKKEGRVIYQKIKKVAQNNIKTPFFLNFLGDIESLKSIESSIENREIITKNSPNSLASHYLNEIVDSIVLQLEHQATAKKDSNPFKLFLKRVVENF